MSSAPTGTSAPSFSRIDAAIRRASGTPRRWMPISKRPSVPACFSTISWERRIVARRISSAVMIRRPVTRSFRPHWATRAASRGRGRRVSAKDTAGAGPSVDVDGDVDDPAPRGATADLEEVRPVEVHDPGRLLRSVVVHHPFDATAATADDHDRAARQAHRRGAMVVERGLAAQRVLWWLAARLRVGPGLLDAGTSRGPG